MRRASLAIDFLTARQGSIAIEFALLTPLFLMLVLGVVDFASAANRQIQLEGAVAMGVQLAVARQPTTGSLVEIETVVRSAAAPAGRSESQAVEVVRFCERLDGSALDCAATNEPRAVFIAIRLAEAWGLIAPYPMIGPTVSLAATSTVRIQ